MCHETMVFSLFLANEKMKVYAAQVRSLKKLFRKFFEMLSTGVFVKREIRTSELLFSHVHAVKSTFVLFEHTYCNVVHIELIQTNLSNCKQTYALLLGEPTNIVLGEISRLLALKKSPESILFDFLNTLR